MITSPKVDCPTDHKRSQQPLRLAIYLADQNPHRDRSLGITAMTRTLMDQFATRDDLSVTQVISRSSHFQKQPSIRTCTIPVRTDRMLGRLFADSIHPWVARPDVDLWYYPKGYVSRFVAPFQPSVGTMHDTIVQHYADHYPETRSSSAFRYWIELTKRSLQRFARVLAVSNHTQTQLLDFCDRYSIEPPAIEVTYESSSWESIRGSTYQKDDYVTHLASPAPHKCTNRLLQFWKTLQQRRRDLPRLELIGNLDPAGESLCASLTGVVRHQPMAVEALQSCIGKSRALLLPSEIEGFGLPAIEAYYVGTPACFVQGTSVSEVVQAEGRAGGFVLADVDSFERSLDWALSVSPATVQATSDAMYEQFSTSQISERIVRAFQHATSR